MVLSGCLTAQDAYQAIEWKVIVLLAGVLGLGTAIEKSGTAQLLASQMLDVVGPYGPLALLSVIYLLTSVLTEMMSNGATGVVVTPVAIATATAIGVDPRPFIVTVAFAASASFMTPVGYQTNTLVYGPGGYRFSDFVRVGTPLNVLYWVLATVLIPMIWPF